MSRKFYTGPRLPGTLLDQVQGGRVNKSSRQERPKQDIRRNATSSAGRERQHTSKRHSTDAGSRTQRRALKGNTTQSLGNASRMKDVQPEHATNENNNAEDSAFDIDEADDSVIDESSGEEHEEDDVQEPIGRSISRTAKARLDDDDEEIARLEKKLGIRSKSTKNSANDDFEFLLGGGSDSEGDGGTKRKLAEDDEWLKNKRRKAQISEQPSKASTPAVKALADDDSDSFDGFSSDDDLSQVDPESEENEIDSGSWLAESKVESTKPKRENPYVAPVPAFTAKYVPPSMRKAATSDEELLQRLKRQLQGLLNKLSEANMLSILHSLEEIYTQNARQFVTSTLVDLLTSLIADPSTLNDTFLILHAGFATAVYKIVGADFGAQMLESTVSSFDKFNGSSDDGKQTLNLLAFLSYLYALQMIGCEVVFDYIKLLLENFSEANTELLLRVIRTSGQNLRQDDPRALKDIVLLLQRAIAKVGEDRLSVRTKFMVEVIQDLKNNRVRAGVAASALAAEHLQRMKKTLGALAQSRHSLKSTEPLRITLSDIRNTEKKGKWWLVGASWKDPAKMADEQDHGVEGRQNEFGANSKPDYESDASEDVDLNRLARSQGMNTDVRKAIFIAVTGAVDIKHAQERVLKLGLRSKQQIEIPRVLLHCVGAETNYNHFYTAVAVRFCGDHKLRKAYEFALMDLFRKFGEKQREDDEDDADDVAEVSTQKIFNLAKMYAFLAAEGLLRIGILKSLDWSRLRPKTMIFLEFFVTSALLFIRKKGKDDFEFNIKSALASPGDAQLCIGLATFITNSVKEATLTFSTKEQKTVKTGCKFAVIALTDASRGISNVVQYSDDSD